MCKADGCAQSGGGSEAEALSTYVNAIAVSLSNITRRNDALLPDGKPPAHTLTVFHALQVPPISVADYVCRIGTYTYCSPECYITAMVYLDRFLSANSRVPLTSLNVHRLLITAVLLAIKARDDAYYSNAYYASIGGISNVELNKLELTFLELIDYRLFVHQSEFNTYKDRLLSYVHAQTIEGIKATAAAAKSDLLKDQSMAVQQQEETTDVVIVQAEEVVQAKRAPTRFQDADTVLEVKKKARETFNKQIACEDTSVIVMEVDENSSQASSGPTLDAFWAVAS
jgi:hypothetical protein